MTRVKERKKERGRERGVLNRLRDFHDGEAASDEPLCLLCAPNLQVEVKAITEPMTNSSKPIPELCGMLTATKKRPLAAHRPVLQIPFSSLIPKAAPVVFGIKSFAVMRDTNGVIRGMLRHFYEIVLNGISSTRVFYSNHLNIIVKSISKKKPHELISQL